jgi:hypothetical protein
VKLIISAKESYDGGILETETGRTNLAHTSGGQLTRTDIVID